MRVVGVGVCRQVLPPADGKERKVRRLMAQPAVLAVEATRRALASTGWDALEEVGQFMGVGPSPAPAAQLKTLAEVGLRAVHPLLAFQLMNNFSLCHAAIDTGLGGPNRALYSVGAETVFALVQARMSRAERVLVGGCDSQGAAVIALSKEGSGPRLLEVHFVGRRRRLPEVATGWVGLSGGHAVPSGWVDLDARFGRCLAADAALGWTAALEALDQHETATAMCWDSNEQLGWVTFERGG